MPEIEKIRILHDLQNQFNVTDEMRNALRSQLEQASSNKFERFVNGFTIENWFEWTFCPMPWVTLIHGLDQQQFPAGSKENYQVPDFLVLVETSALSQQPLLVEVKRASRDKKTLKLQGSQVSLSQRYAITLNLPLVIAVYWEFLSSWTLNTIDVFEEKSSSHKLTLETAVETDCSAILGDISYLIPKGLIRRSRFTKSGITEECVQHREYGRLLSDVLVSGDKQIELVSVESAAVDSILGMRVHATSNQADGVTELIEVIDSVHMPKLSSWITRHLSTFGQVPSEKNAGLSSYVITNLMNRLGCPVIHLFPECRTAELKRLNAIFRTAASSKTI